MFAKEVRNYTYFIRAFEILTAFRLGHVTLFSIQVIHLGRQPFWIGGRMPVSFLGYSVLY